MRKKLAYFLLLILTASVLIGCSTGLDSKSIKNQAYISCSDVDVHYFDYDTPNVDLNVPRQISGISSIHRTPNVSKRSSNWHKNNFEFVKIGKVVCACICNFFQKESLNYHHCFVKSASWLILGKLII